MTRLEEIKERLSKTSGHSWKAIKMGENILCHHGVCPATEDCIVDSNLEEVLSSSEWLIVKWDDLNFMAHSHDDLKYLLDEVENPKLVEGISCSEKSNNYCSILIKG